MLVLPVSESLPVEERVTPPVALIKRVEFAVADEMVPLFTSLFDVTSFTIVPIDTIEEVEVNVR